jgi:uncharacterized protein (UPF0218 family)/phosphopantetheine adenylyltransferase
MKLPQLNHVVVAGTFDHFHAGHEHLLKTAFSYSNYVSCGIYQNSQKKILSSQIQDFSSRQHQIKNFLKKNHLLKKTEIFPLFDIYGPTLKKTSIQAIIATDESFPGVQKINQKRKIFCLKPLPYILSNLIYTTDQRRLSSTLIRLGQTNPQGLSYLKLLPPKTLRLPFNQKPHFKKPIGKLIPETSSTSWPAFCARQIIKNENPPLVITVGDISTQSFVQNQINFNFAIIDFKFRRQNLPANFHQNLLQNANITQAINPPGTLSANLIKKLKILLPKIIFSQKIEILKINGEEDLSVLPLILLSPINSLIFYGQPGQGIVKVKVTQKTKLKTLRLLKKFS